MEKKVTLQVDTRRSTIITENRILLRKYACVFSSVGEFSLFFESGRDMEIEEEDSPLLFAPSKEKKKKVVDGKSGGSEVKISEKKSLKKSALDGREVVEEDRSDVKIAFDDDVNITFQDMKLKKWIVNCLKQMGLDEPTPIQKHAIPAIMQGKYQLDFHSKHI